VTFDPDKGDLRCANSRKKVTMYPEKGDFFRPHAEIRNHPEKGDLFLPGFKGSPGETLFSPFQRSTRKKVTFAFVFQKEQVPKKE
jgi:hypothetical protein